jgi:hypothetical protein
MLIIFAASGGNVSRSRNRTGVRCGEFASEFGCLPVSSCNSRRHSSERSPHSRPSPPKASAHSPALAREPTISQTVEVIRASTKPPIYPHIFAAKTVSNCARAQFAIGEKGWGDDRCVKRSSRSVEFPRGSQRVLAVSSSRGASGSKDCFNGNGNWVAKARQWKSSATLQLEPTDNS